MSLDSWELSKIQLMGDYLLIEAFDRNETKGFIIPDNKKDKPTTGKVIKVGNGHLSDKKIDMVIKNDFIVLFNEWSAKPLEGLKGHSKLFYIKQSEIIAYMEDK